MEIESNKVRAIGIFFVLLMLLFPIVLMDSVKPTKLSGAVEVKNVSKITLEESWIKNHITLYEQTHSRYSLEGHNISYKNVIYCNSSIKKYIKVEDGRFFENDEKEIVIGEDILIAFRNAGYDISKGDKVDIKINHYIPNGSQSNLLLNQTDKYELTISGIVPKSMGDLSNLIFIPYRLGDKDNYRPSRHLIEPTAEITLKGAMKYLAKNGADVVGGSDEADFQMFRMYMTVSITFAMIFSIVMLILIESISRANDIKKMIITKVWGGNIKRFLMDQLKKKGIYITISAFGAYLVISGVCLLIFPHLNIIFRHIFFKLEFASIKLLVIVLSTALIVIVMDILSLYYKIKNITLNEYLREGWKR